MTSDGMGYSLDDYIYSLEARGGARPGGGADTETDIHGQLLAKERDLILAAELGKALLEKNEDLSKQNEKIAEEFSLKLEVGWGARGPWPETLQPGQRVGRPLDYSA